jgi:hypothetical protein
LTQVINYIFTIRSTKVSLLCRTFVLLLGLSGIILAALAGYRASIDWSKLPQSPNGLHPGQLWDDGGIPAIVEKQK